MKKLKRGIFVESSVTNFNNSKCIYGATATMVIVYLVYRKLTVDTDVAFLP